MQTLISLLTSNSLVLALASIAGYVVLIKLIFDEEHQEDSNLYESGSASEGLIAHDSRNLLLTLPVIFIHLLFLISAIIQKDLGDYGFNFGLVNIIALMGWLVAVITSTNSFLRPLLKLAIFAFPLAILSIFLVLIFPSQSKLLTDINSFALMHIILSLLAFGVLTITAAQALVISTFIYRLKHKLNSNSLFGVSIPPLQTLEGSLFSTINIGMILLSLSILSGFLFLEDMFAQHVAHKTFLSIVAWFVLLAMILGRIRFGWRGSIAIKMVLSAYALLFLAFLGSKFVLEILLERF